MSTDKKGVAIVTGCAQGMGYDIALRLASDGFDIGLNDIDTPSKRELLCAAVDDIVKLGRRAVVVAADVTVEAEVKGVVDEVVRQLGSLDVMVANAGISAPLMPFHQTTVEEWDRVMTVNGRGLFLCYKYAAEQMIQQGRGGRIMGASSHAATLSLPLNGAYCASKFAVRGLTQTAALELGQYGITVNTYAPGVIHTPMTDTWIQNNSNGKHKDDLHNYLVTHIGRRPIKDQGRPEHIASIVSYLASKEASFITGQTIVVDGGITLS